MLEWHHHGKRTNGWPDTDIDMSARLLPVSLEAQIVPGSFAHAVYHLVGELDLSRFDAHYRNDEAGAPAHSPAMLLRAVLLAY